MFPSRLASMTPRRKWLLAAIGLLVISWGILEWYQRQSVLPPPPKWTGIDFSTLEEVQLLQEYVAIDTTSGKEAAGAEWLAANLRDHGIEPHVERLATGQANLWAVIEGKRPEALVLHHHIDVRDVIPEHWRTPPFEGTIQGPLMYGRGVFDMKGYGVAQLMAFLDVAKSGIQPEYSLILLATSDEENGSRFGTRWFLRQHPEVAERFWAVLTEGGIAEALKADLVRYWGIEVGQMRWVEVIACSGNRERLEALRRDIELLLPTNIQVLPVAAEMFPLLAPYRRQPRHSEALSEPEHLVYDARRVDDLPAYARFLLSHQRTILGIREADGGGHELGLMLVMLPTENGDAPEELLPTDLMAGMEVKITEFPWSPPSSTAHPVFTTLTRRLRDITEADAGPHLLSYTATDSRSFRAAGITSFGYSPFGYVAVDTRQVDRHNEKILLTAYVDGVAEYRAAVKEIVGLVNGES